MCDVTCCDLHNYSIIAWYNYKNNMHIVDKKLWKGTVIAKAPPCMPTEIYNLETGFP